MKRTFLMTIILLAACASASLDQKGKFGTVTVRAQSLPVTKSLEWTQADATTAEVTGYTVTQDGAVSTVGPCTPDPTKCTKSVVFSTAGTHTFTVVATNAWGASIAATLTVNVVVPGKSTNLTIK